MVTVVSQLMIIRTLLSIFDVASLGFIFTAAYIKKLRKNERNIKQYSSITVAVTTVYGNEEDKREGVRRTDIAKVFTCLIEHAVVKRTVG